MSTKVRAVAAGGPAPGRDAPPLCWPAWPAGLALVAAVVLAYAGTLSAPFILDDVPAIIGNPTMGHLWRALAPPRGLPVSGRPLLNLSFALNYAAGGTGVLGYHAANLLVHALCALAVFGIALRTLARPPFGARLGRDRLPIAFLAACVWAVHPLNTEAVTYVSERAEALMALFYLAALYFFIRAESSARPTAWLGASIAAVLMGSLTKEVIVTAPLVVLLYDRTFLAGTFGGALRLRWRYYALLAASLLPLALLMPGTGQRGVGFGDGVGMWSYAAISSRSVMLYLKQAFWPNPLVFDYGAAVPLGAPQLAPCVAGLAALLALTIVALRRWPAAGFACAWFLIILAPTTSLVPLAYQPVAEHRAYLPLAAVACAAAVAAHRLLGRRAILLLAALAVVLGWLTVQRNRDYRSEVSIWEDSVSKRPGNARAHGNLGAALAKIPGREREAISEYEEALRLKPDYAEAHNDLGLILARSFGRFPEAAAEFEAALRSRPDYAEAQDNLGMALAQLPGRLPDAIAHYEDALRIAPGYAKAHNDLGIALAGTPGRLRDAIAQFEEALRLRPDYADARKNLETAREMLGRDGQR